MVGSLLAQGASYTISVAAAVGDQERVEQLLRKDASLAKRLDSARVSALSYAAREGHTHIVRMLLAYGADPNIPEEGAPEGRALFEACCANHFGSPSYYPGANPNAGLDRQVLSDGGTVYHDDRRSRCSSSCVGMAPTRRRTR
jgi:ankyrin repeat protein